MKIGFELSGWPSSFLFFIYLQLNFIRLSTIAPMSKAKKSVEVEPTKSRMETPAGPKMVDSLTFGKRNYYFILGGLALIFLGLILMSGGHMPSADVWDESLIYSTRRILIAPILILAGLVLQIVAIFTKKQ